MGLAYLTGPGSPGAGFYDEFALLCTTAIDEPRSLGLTIAEIRDPGRRLPGAGPPIRPVCTLRHCCARDPADARISSLAELQEGIDRTLVNDDLTDGALRDTDPTHPAMLDLFLRASRNAGAEGFPYRS